VGACAAGIHICWVTLRAPFLPRMAGQRSPALREGAGALSGARPMMRSFLLPLGETELGPTLPVT